MTDSPAPTTRTQAPARLYYGWVIVGVIMLSGLAASVQLNPTIGVFVKPITGEFGWSRSTLAGAVTAGTICGGLVAVFIGPLVDRFGGKWILFFGFLFMGGALIALGFINTLWQFYLIFIVSRMLLQGVIQLTNNVVVAKWFIRMRGRAVSIANMGQRIGNGATPLFAQTFVSGFGWRPATVAVGLLAWSLTLGPVLLWLRRQPEDMDLAADGDDPAKREESAQSKPERTRSVFAETSFTLKEALHTRAFYIVLAAMSVSFLSGAGINFNMLALFTDRGLSASQGVLIVTAWSFLGLPALLLGGLLSERLPVRRILVVVYLGVAVGIGLLTRVNSIPTGIAFAVVHGSFFGAMPVLQSLILANYFGRGHLGSIRGLVTPVSMACNAVGPLIAAAVFDATGSYGPILTVFMGLMALAALGMLLAHPPTLKSPPAAG